jgi:hypothetical protein
LINAKRALGAINGFIAELAARDNEADAFAAVIYGN